MLKIVLLVFISLQCFSLEIDEKLTLRILELSDSKKTILVNRGLEDGLVVGDHAKFFLSKGVVARGVVVKASPSRSIWSLYRLVYPEDIVKENVVNLKISSEVKLTEDSTKALTAMSLANEEFGEPVSITQNEKTETIKVSTSDSDEIASLMNEDMESSRPARNKSAQKALPKKKEIVAFTDHSIALNFAYSVNQLENSYDNETSVVTDATGGNALNFSVEKYFPTSKSFVKDVSVKLLYSSYTLPSGYGVDNTIDHTDMGLGLSYHFYNSPHMIKSFVAYAEAEFGLSNLTVNSDSESFVRDGSGTFYSLGVGAKYLINSNFQVFAKADTYQTAASFEFTNLISQNVVTEIYQASGTRLFFGLSYKMF